MTFPNAYMWSNPGAQDITYILRNASINPVTMMFRNKGRAYIWLNRTQYGSVTIKNGGSGDELKGQVEFSIEGGSGNSIGDITHEALSLRLKGGASQVLTVTTLNQNSAGDTQVFNNVTITDANANNGLIHNNGGTITNANINGGEFRQTSGTTDTATLNNGTLDQIDGTISTLNQSGGQATQEGGTITNLNQSGGQAIQSGGTITTANLSGGTFTHNGGTLSNVVLKAGGSGSTFVNGTDSAFANITQEGGNHTIIGKVTKFTLASGSFTNNGSITTLTTNTTTTKQARSGTSFYAAQAATTNHITNNGTIDKLELTKDADSVTNNAVYNTGGGLASGIIKELDVKSGNATINTLNGVGQGTAANIEPHTLSNINITKDAKLTVDTLSVGLKGNQAIERVTINNNTGNNGGNKEFAVNKIQV
ncbi:autotransporter adhesin family protein, partial [Helicobacter sp. XJK30-2]